MKTQCAFTLIEALTVLAILSILTMLTIPGLQSMLQRAQDDALRNEMMRLIDTARNEAQLSRKSITLCKSQNQRTCSGEWSDGQIIFIDSAHDGVVHDPSQIISVNKMHKSRGQLHVRSYPRYRDTIQFQPIIAESNDNGTLWFCRANVSTPAWAIKINKMGEAHVMLPDDNGEINDGSGKMIPC